MNAIFKSNNTAIFHNDDDKKDRAVVGFLLTVFVLLVFIFAWYYCEIIGSIEASESRNQGMCVCVSLVLGFILCFLMLFLTLVKFNKIFVRGGDVKEPIV